MITIHMKRWKLNTVIYEVKKMSSKDFDEDLLNWFFNCGDAVNIAYEKGYNFRSFDLATFSDHQHIWLCLKDSKPVGFLIATITRNFFDHGKTHLIQNLLFAIPNTRAAYLLFKEFIDFGKVNVNYIDCAIGRYTNVKPETLFKMGFTEVETLYRMEV